VTVARRLRVACALALLAAACSSDDDAASTTAPPVTSAAAATPPTDAASTSPATSPSTSPATAVAATVPPPTTTLTTTTVAPVSAGATPYDALAAALLDREELELPPDWVTRELDPRVALDPALTADFDPFLGLVECADGVLREGPDAVWTERSIVGPGDPQDDGLLSVRMTIERESAADHAADLEQLGACAPTNPQVLVEAAPTSIDVGGRSVEGQHVLVSAAPTADVAFPSAFAYTVTHTDGLSVSVLMYGLDLGQDWGPRSDQVAGRILDRAD
jgi:hypothetical protein